MARVLSETGILTAAAMLIERSGQYFSGLDYAAQFGFYKSDAGKELMKFSFMTTFTRRKDSVNRR